MVLKAFGDFPVSMVLKYPLNYSVEKCCLAVGELVECDSMKAGSRRNNAVVMFLDSIDKVSSLVERGVVLRKIILSNFPTIGNDVLLQQLSRHDQQRQCSPLGANRQS